MRNDSTSEIYPTLLRLTEDMSPFSLICQRRGWTPGTLAALDEVTDQELPDLDAAAELIDRAREEDLQITVITDYDMDGVAAGLLTYAGLNELGITANLVIPHYEGVRDVDRAKVDQAISQYPETGMIITCDVGINSNSGIDRAHELDIPVIVADHHIEGSERCRADAVVDPNRTGCDYPEPDICGAQVSLHILNRYARDHRPDKARAMDNLSLFAGIGGLADVMPLRGQTRPLVRKALSLISLSFPVVPVYTEEDDVPPYRIGEWNTEDPLAINVEGSTLAGLLSYEEHHPAYVDLFRGVSIIIAHLISAGKLKSTADIDASFLGFTWTPMFNSTRRIEGDMADSFVIFAPDAVRKSRPDYAIGVDDLTARHAGAEQIIANNERRKEITKQIYAEMIEDDQPMAPHVWFVPDSTPPGILGLLASKITSELGVPSLVARPGAIGGSARAPEWFDVLGTVASLGLPGLTAAGHHQACGVRGSSLTDLEAFAVECAAQTEAFLAEQGEGSGRADLSMIDIENLSEIDESDIGVIAGADVIIPPAGKLISLVHQLEELGPFGHGFPEPRIEVTFQPKHTMVRPLSLTDTAQERIELDRSNGVPTTLEITDYKHLKISLPHGLTLLWWNSTANAEALMNSPLVTMSVTLGINEFAGNISPQAIVDTVDYH